MQSGETQLLKRRLPISGEEDDTKKTQEYAYIGAHRLRSCNRRTNNVTKKCLAEPIVEDQQKTGNVVCSLAPGDFQAITIIVLFDPRMPHPFALATAHTIQPTGRLTNQIIRTVPYHHKRPSPLTHHHHHHHCQTHLPKIPRRSKGRTSPTQSSTASAVPP